MSNVCFHCGMPLDKHIVEMRNLGLPTINEKFYEVDKDQKLFSLFEKYQLSLCCRIYLTGYASDDYKYLSSDVVDK